ncbi:MAG: hypothetical protein PVJ75_01590, partial [Chloroflexota bacterium]
AVRPFFYAPYETQILTIIEQGYPDEYVLLNPPPELVEYSEPGLYVLACPAQAPIASFQSALYRDSLE